jgi:hypothetical protein
VESKAAEDYLESVIASIVDEERSTKEGELKKPAGQAGDSAKDQKGTVAEEPNRTNERCKPLHAMLLEAEKAGGKVRPGGKARNEAAQASAGQHEQDKGNGEPVSKMVNQEARTRVLEVLREGLERHAEDMTRKLNETCEEQGSVEAIVKVYVSDCPRRKREPFAPDEQESLERHDERRLIWWDFERGFPRIAMARHHHVDSDSHRNS